MSGMIDTRSWCLITEAWARGEKPLMRYSSSEMARDILEVLNHVGWVAASGPPSRDIHVVGLSLGGMIAQELACSDPGPRSAA